MTTPSPSPKTLSVAIPKPMLPFTLTTMNVLLLEPVLLMANAMGLMAGMIEPVTPNPVTTLVDEALTVNRSNLLHLTVRRAAILSVVYSLAASAERHWPGAHSFAWAFVGYWLLASVAVGVDYLNLFRQGRRDFHRAYTTFDRSKRPPAPPVAPEPVAAAPVAPATPVAPSDDPAFGFILPTHLPPV